MRSLQRSGFRPPFRRCISASTSASRSVLFLMEAVNYTDGFGRAFATLQASFHAKWGAATQRGICCAALIN